MTDRGPSDPPEARVRRADETGTSAKPSPWAPGYTGPLEGAWHDTGFIVEGRKWLPRDRIAVFLETYLRTKQMPYALLDDLHRDD
ncbi:hypothetical protein CFP71_09995 [Amycolatopsis thailandensis]|uniref:Uncharacterized protein n=1 Tax=Amycolatopsis thailandensis TaxID=589330 RepID=A0A229SDR2_9PSEU|nr:hypothetical protein [Amycolatopsis thailandensis]OXM57057.1 hypothetical protein CFP71_09995 [Amycolatopsis thailandensis]